MATKASDIFAMAMDLMDERGADGVIPASDTAEYKNRTLSILNMLRGELYPFSDTYTNDTEDGRPISTYIKNFDAPIDLDDHICQSIMPYGLAAHLLVDENPTVAQFFNERYNELKANLVRGLPAEEEQITDVYFGDYNPYNDFGRWY